ncbi:hypothetical protein NBRC116596_22620 [Litorivita sp. NS0012-18]
MRNTNKSRRFKPKGAWSISHAALVLSSAALAAKKPVTMSAASSTAMSQCKRMAIEPYRDAVLLIGMGLSLSCDAAL